MKIRLIKHSGVHPSRCLEVIYKHDPPNQSIRLLMKISPMSKGNILFPHLNMKIHCKPKVNQYHAHQAYEMHSQHHSIVQCNSQTKHYDIGRSLHRSITAEELGYQSLLIKIFPIFPEYNSSPYYAY